MTTPPALIADDLSRAFGTHIAVDRASLRLEPGQITALIGASGSGKTTLLRLLAGMERPDSGRVLSGTEELSSEAKFVPIEKRRIGLVFQDFALLDYLSVLDNILLPYRISRALQLDTHVRDLAGNAFDGDGDGVAGGNYVDEFFRLYGDINGDRAVTAIDFNTFASYFGLPVDDDPIAKSLDFNDDQVITAIDFNEFAQQFGKILPPN